MPDDFASAEVFVAVSQIVADYMDAVDGGDFDRLAGILADAKCVMPSGAVVSGFETIRSAYASAQPVPDADGRRKTKHQLANLRVRMTGADRLAADSYYFMFAPGADGPVVAKCGRYSQDYELRDGRWVIVRHQVIPDF